MRSRHRGSKSSSRLRFPSGWCRWTPRSRSRQKKLPGISRQPEFPGRRSSEPSKVVRSTTDPGLHLLTAAAVRERCELVYRAAERGETPHFRLVSMRLHDAVRRVAEVTRRRYPDLAVPFHSRWRHFSTGGIDRTAQVAPGMDPDETARARIDLAVVSVLLDAGAGPQWGFYDADTGRTLGRSEGLAVASLGAMKAGLFSADLGNPWRADAEALARLSAERLAAAFQHRPGNELLGVEARAALLRRVGEACAAAPVLFGVPPRLGNLFDYWGSRGAEISAPEILRLLLTAFGSIWPSRASIGGVLLGDCGRHSVVPGDGIVPFHKLSQWLAYSLVEPLGAAGLRVTDIDG